MLDRLVLETLPGIQRAEGAAGADYLLAKRIVRAYMGEDLHLFALKQSGELGPYARRRSLYRLEKEVAKALEALGRLFPQYLK
ncbi:MAG: hypothetical protein M5U25_11225 [Planctomycetota bacterium]|nr:hypothetical protein [Planctomycetota bacterium]